MNIEKSLIQKVALLLIREGCEAELTKNIAKEIISIHSHRLTHRKEKGHEEFFDALFKALAPYEREIKAMLHRIWDEERRIILANLKKLKKGHFRKDNIDDILYPKNEFIKKLSKEAKALYLQLIKERGQYYLSQFKPEIAFDVTNPRVIEWLDSYVPEFSKNLEAVNAADITRVLSEGMDAGETIPELMARINETFETWNRYRAEIISRTESSRASNQAWLEGAKQSGVVEKKIWMAAPGCCEECDILDGTVVEIDGNFFETDYGTGDSPPLHPNCVLPGTFCETPGGLIIGLRAWYDGEAIEFTFANGRRLSVTPNHMFLTPHGFAPAHLLRDGDDIFYCPDTQGVISGHPDDNRKPTLIEQIIDSFAESGSMFIRRMPVTPEYLHGDGRFCNGNIDIIGSNGLLGNAIESTAPKIGSDDSFNAGRMTLSDFFPPGSFAEILHRAAHTADSIMGGLRQPSPFFLSRLAHPNEHGFTSIAGMNISTKQTPPDTPPANFESFTKSLFRKSELIQLNKIIDINIFPFHGYVYDLQTSTSLYIANGIISSNCRCSVAAEIEETSSG